MRRAKTKPRDKDDVTESQEREVWELRRTGASQQRIAAELGIDQSTVSRMIKRMTEKLKMEFVEREEEIKIGQTAVLEHIIEESLQEWRRSKLNAQTRRKQTKAMGAAPKAFPDDDENETTLTPEEIRGMYLRPSDANPDQYEEEEDPEGYAASHGAPRVQDGLVLVEEKNFTESKGQTGDAALLQAARAAMADIRTIWGVDAPKKQEISGPGGKPIEIDSAATKQAAEELTEWRKQMMGDLANLQNVPPT